MAASSHKYWVAKFGGTSLATYQAMIRCANIVTSHPAIRVVVVSAPSGVTNLLVKLSQTYLNGTKSKPIFNEIKYKVNAILDSFPQTLFPELHQKIEGMFQHIDNLTISLNKKYCPQLADELLSLGEQFSARLFQALLSSQGYDASYQDARKLIKTDNGFGKASVLIQETKKQATEYLLQKNTHQIIVTEGFIGSTTEEVTTTLGREGSDYSAAILTSVLSKQR